MLIISAKVLGGGLAPNYVVDNRNGLKKEKFFMYCIYYSNLLVEGPNSEETVAH